MGRVESGTEEAWEVIGWSVSTVISFLVSTLLERNLRIINGIGMFKLRP